MKSEKSLEKEIKKLIKNNPDDPRVFDLVDKWFWLSELRLRPAGRFVKEFMNKHFAQNKKEFNKWLSR